MKRVVRKGFGFIDSLRIHLKGGVGGNGLPTKGGIGGRGGDIIVLGNKSEKLIDVRKRFPSLRFTAEKGEDARFFCLYGANGKPTVIEVPVGVSVITDDGNKLGEIIQEGDKIVAAKGGDGGSLVNGFSGQIGQIHSIKLDLKLIADIGFVGFPNAGKSTLLRSLSRASPKIASYPFTTIRPNIGIMEYQDGRRISLADLPGLIEGAHANVGMGHKFLKHVERTKLLLFVVDLQGFQLGVKYPTRTALETIFFLNKELELYREDLMDKPAVLCLNKSDLPGSMEIALKIQDILDKKELLNEYVQTLPKDYIPKRLIQFDKVITISAKTAKQYTLKETLRNIIDVNYSFDELNKTKVREAANLQ